MLPWYRVLSPSPGALDAIAEQPRKHFPATSIAHRHCLQPHPGLAFGCTPRCLHPQSHFPPPRQGPGHTPTETNKTRRNLALEGRVPCRAPSTRKKAPTLPISPAPHLGVGSPPIASQEDELSPSSREWRAGGRAVGAACSFPASRRGLTAGLPGRPCVRWLLRQVPSRQTLVLSPAPSSPRALRKGK